MKNKDYFKIEEFSSEKECKEWLKAQDPTLLRWYSKLKNGRFVAVFVAVEEQDD